MSKSKFSKKQIASALLLSSTAIGATASGTASAGFIDFMKKAIGDVAGKVGNFVSGHVWGVTSVTLLGIIAYGTYKAIKARISLFKEAKKKLLDDISKLIKEIKEVNKEVNKDERNYKTFIEKLEKLQTMVSSEKYDDNFYEDSLDKASKNLSTPISSEQLGKLLKDIKHYLELYKEEYTELHSNKIIPLFL